MFLNWGARDVGHRADSYLAHCSRLHRFSLNIGKNGRRGERLKVFKKHIL